MYHSDDLRDDWEFKIVRSSLGAFRNPDTMRQVVEREAQAGWQLLEKFDDNRLRFKRPASARDSDDLLPKDRDPYLTRYGPSEAAVAFGIVVGILLLVLILAAVASAGQTVVR